MRALIIRTAWLLLVCAAAGAQAPDATDRTSIGERPDPVGTPTPVSVRVYLFDIGEIDDDKQRFTADLFMNIQWRDARLAVPETSRGGQLRIMPLGSIWTPRGLIVNDRGMSSQLPEVVEVDDLGNVEYRQRFSGDMAADLVYADFPFDTQRLPIDFVSYRYTPDELQFSPDSSITGDVSQFSEEGWQFEFVEPEFSAFSIPAEDILRSRLAFYVEARRNTGYYLWTMFLPLTLIVFMSWMAFWLQPNLVPPRIGIATATVFSLIAFGFSIRVSLPPVPYLTRADVLVTGCTFLVFLSLAVTIIGSRWASGEHMERALRLNAIARWVYAGLFLLVVATALLR
ncbi:MAG: hypothetical protein ACN4GT_06980 [Gammaproteobacteria bacterium]